MAETTRAAAPLRQVPLMHELVAEHLTSEIVQGVLKPGERLNEVQLAARLGISRSPMREALRQLENDGLVVSENRRGTWVAEMDERIAADFYDCRILVESQCARLSAAHITDEDVDEARQVLEEMRQKAGLGLIYPRLSLIEQFHMTYRLRCPNEELVALIQRLGRRALRFRSIRIMQGGSEKDSIRQHRIILAAMQDRDPEAMASSVTDLLNTSKDVIADWFAEKNRAGSDPGPAEK